jgi:uncharacterized MAPEG superfamily protein
VLRAFFAAFVAAVIFSALFGPNVSPDAIGATFLIIFLAIILFNAGKFKCPYCRKRVKLFATVCHHCGNEVHSWWDRLLTRRPPN